jgi:hypothetical protein
VCKLDSASVATISRMPDFVESNIIQLLEEGTQASYSGHVTDIHARDMIVSIHCWLHSLTNCINYGGRGHISRPSPGNLVFEIELSPKPYPFSLPSVV